MFITDPTEIELAGRDPAREPLQDTLRLCPGPDSCLPSLDLVTGKEGTALLELESIIRGQLESGSQGDSQLSSKNYNGCKPLQGPNTMDLLAVTKGRT